MKESLSAIAARLKSLSRHLTTPDVEGTSWQLIVDRDADELSSLRRPQVDLRVLCATSVGGHAIVRTIDSLVATSLWLRGVQTTSLLCDKVLPACEATMYSNFPVPEQFVRHGPRQTHCDSCFLGGSAYYAPLPFEKARYSDFLGANTLRDAELEASDLTVQECFAYHDQRGLDLGEQCRAGVLRFFGKAVLDDENPDYVEAVVQRYLAGAIVSAEVTRAALERLRPDVIVAHHGVYVPQGVLGQVARSLGIRVVNWGISYRNTTVIYSHDDTYHHTFMSEPVANWENIPLSGQVRDRLMAYLQERRGGKGDWTWVTPDRGERGLIEEHAPMIADLGLDPAKPIIGLLTNVLWDAQLYYQGQAFDDMLDWLFTTIDYYIEHPDVQLVIRVHPHEVKGGNRQPTAPEIRNRYPHLPSNIKVVDRDSPYSTYALMDLCRAVVIYGTKTGVELAPYGTPVVIAGEAWMRNKGISWDITDRTSYQSVLDQLPTISPLSAPVIERAQKYAYHYFFRRMIPLGLLDPDGGAQLKLKVQSLRQLMPGSDRGLDTICDGIMTGGDFIYDPDV